jgi:hypothetical protein
VFAHRSAAPDLRLSKSHLELRPRLAEFERHDPTVKILQPPAEMKGFPYLMIWHPRLDTDAAHSWLRSMVRAAGKALSISSQHAVGHGFSCAAVAWHGRGLVCYADFSFGRNLGVGRTALIDPRKKLVTRRQ